MATKFRPIPTNLTPVRIAGAGGIPILVLVVLMAIVFPIVRWVLVFGAISGGIVAATMIRARRKRQDADPGDGSLKLKGAGDGEHAGDRPPVGLGLDGPRRPGGDSCRDWLVAMGAVSVTRT